MKISYIISTYKSEKFIERRIRNLIIDQSDSDFEIIVVDSCSPENEKDIVEKWQVMYPDRIKYMRQSERTPYGVSWLEGWKIASGDFCVNANTDDYSHKDFTSIVHKEFQLAISQNKILRWCKDIGFAYTGITVINENGQVLGGGLKPKFDYHEYSHTCYGGPMLAWRNDQEFRKSIDWELLYKRAKSYRSAFDYTLALYFMSLGYHGYSIQQNLTIYTQRPDSIENSAPAVNTYEALCSIAEFFPHHITGKLKCYSEFAKFPLVPIKDKWVECRRTNKTWKDEYGYVVIE